MPKSIEYYLSMGCDRAVAEYFASGRKSITAVTPNKDFTLTIVFDNGEKRRYDVNRVYIDKTHCIAWDIDPTVDSEVVWSNKLDLCPDSCYIDSVPI